MSYHKYLFVIYFLIYIFMSFISIIVYKVDKEKAKKDKPRIKEKTLLFVTVFNGSFGSFLARIIFRHKTEKKYFSFVINLSLFVQTIVLFYLAYLAYKY